MENSVNDQTTAFCLIDLVCEWTEYHMTFKKYVNEVGMQKKKNLGSVMLTKMKP